MQCLVEVLPPLQTTLKIWVVFAIVEEVTVGFAREAAIPGERWIA
jgi:hypothetical protein